ncbi:MAG: hypothetical protein R2750_12930 [Bacteroidales bacterium]
MNKIEILIQILISTIAIAAWLISYTQLRRTRRQNNEDYIFNQKLDCYRVLIRKSFDFLQDTFSLLDELPDFKGTKDEWTKEKMPSLYRLHYPKIEQMECTIKEYSFLFPEYFIDEFDNFLFRSARFIVEHYHFNNEHSINNYDKLTEIHNELINLTRKDLHINVLNKKLNYRLKE